MAHDLLIRNGLIVDGTGNPPVHGDVAVSNGTITAVGKVDGTAKREIDADGHAITPGFVDLHTHLDAQAGWDPLLTPVSWHGVTTALFGNCGVTFAPCKPADRRFLAEMMESVEDIPREAILTGLSWQWESYGEYLDAIEKLRPAINVAGLVGHCASRFYVMGERAIGGQPTAEETAEIAALVGRSVGEGAIGFSTNRLPGHTLPDGRSIPGTFAQEAELVAIAREVGKRNGIVQSVLNYGQLPAEMALLETIGKASGARLLFSAPQTAGRDGQGTAYDDAIASMRAHGVDISGLTMPRSGGTLIGLANNVLFAGKTWNELRKQDLAGRLNAIRDSAVRARLIEEGMAMPNIEQRARNMFWISDGQRPDYTQRSASSLAALAQAAGESPIATWLRYMLEHNGKGYFHARFFNFNLPAVGEFLAADWVLPGIGDAGAHVSQIMDSGWTSFLLAHWHRGEGRFSLAEAVRRMTSAPARVIGMNDRGTLAVGKRADINVIDVSRVAERQPELVHDFPGGAPRFIQRAVGYRATVCNGTVILRDDEHTGERGGAMLRNRGAA